MSLLPNLVTGVDAKAPTAIAPPKKKMPSLSPMQNVQPAAVPAAPERPTRLTPANAALTAAVVAPAPQPVVEGPGPRTQPFYTKDGSGHIWKNVPGRQRQLMFTIDSAGCTVVELDLVFAALMASLSKE